MWRSRGLSADVVRSKIRAVSSAIRRPGFVLAAFVGFSFVSAAETSVVGERVIDASGQEIIENENGSLSFLNRSFAARDFSGVAGIASETAYLIVVAGELSTDGVTAKRGEMIIIPAYQAPLSKHVFDAQRLKAGFVDNDQELSTRFQDQLDRLSSRQSRDVFWGRYQPTRLNIAAPDSADDELARRSVVNNETVQSLRFSTMVDEDQLAARIVDKFSTALRDGDQDTVANLLDPSGFGFSDLRGGGAEARALYAQKMINQNNWRELLAQNTFVPSQQQGVWNLSARDRDVRLHLRSHGDFVFVSLSDGGE